MEIEEFQTKPVRIKAVQFKGGAANAVPIIDWMLDNDTAASWNEAHEAWESGDGQGYPARPEGISIDTLGGTMRASVGDWIVQGINGEFYRCNPDIFANAYEKVN